MAVRELRARRSYSTQAVPDAQIERWIDDARWCGSSRNLQPWRFISVRDQESLAELSKLGDFASHVAGCSVAIAIAMGPGPYPFSRTLDLGRMVQTLMLLAHDAGVASCIAVFEPRVHVEMASRLLGVPDGYVVDLAISFGFPTQPDVELSPGPSQRGRLPLSVLLHRERFDDS